MSVLETDLVDYIYLDEDEQTPVLVVSDPLSWRPPEDAAHLEALREKLNSQIAFVQTGQIRGVWPDYRGGLVRVEVIAQNPLTDLAEQFYRRAREVMTGANMELAVQFLDA